MGEDSVILFPEGTRGSGGSMGPFKSGVYHLWRARPQAQVVPVHLHNLGRVLPKGEFAPVPLLASVTLGPPLEFAPDCTCASFLEQLRAAIEGLGAV
jgi:1-acyl-sn-glycerol-3-phosphate acyltransferase